MVTRRTRRAEPNSSSAQALATISENSPGPAIGLRDVARAAGVSTATVSRAINQPEVVSEELRNRIAAVIEHLGWVPDGAARALATRRSGAVGAVFPTLSHGDFARATNALQRELLADGYTLLLACSEYDQEQEFRQVRKFVERGVDGMILVGGEHHAGLVTLLKRQNVPSINTFIYNRESHGDAIGPDNRRALTEMTNYLISLGHRRFGVIWQSVYNNDRAAARLAGIGDALTAHGLAAAPNHFAKELSGIAEARTLFRRAIGASPRPTAIICGNAYLAVGAELEALAMGLSIPRDISIVGYDDIELLSELPVPITTVRVPSDKIGQRAARYIVARILGREEITQFECNPEIVFRASSAPPNSDNQS
jgi:LacI family transcriptional regulator